MGQDYFMMSGEGDFIKDMMKTNVISIDSTNSLQEAAIKMEKAKVGSVIVTKNNDPVGIVTERDFVTRVASRGKPSTLPVSEVMSSPLITINQDETVWEAAEIMKTKNIHKLPVLDGKKVIGIITNTDLVSLASLGSDSEMRKVCDQILLRMKN